MDYINKNVSINLKRIRKAKKMSLDVVAEQTGVSKSMLGQIERGESNPTIGILGKIVSGLRVSFNDLVSVPNEEVYLVRKEGLEPSKESTKEYLVYTVFPYEQDRDFEIYTIEIEPNGCYESGSHGEKTMEYINVYEGVLTLEINNEVYEIRKGDDIRINTDKDHVYKNKGKEKLVINVVFNWN